MKRTTYILIGMYLLGMIMTFVSIVYLGGVLQK